MSALPDPQVHWRPMLASHLDAVLAIELAAYPVPWTRGNFIDSIAAGYDVWLRLDARHTLLGYYVAMEGVDEMHLLNLTVAPAWQGRGHARAMLDHLVALCRERGDRELWLEVRQSNTRAKALYERYGFQPVRVRRGYYPLPPGQPGREDAAVMSLTLEAP